MHATWSAQLIFLDSIILHIFAEFLVQFSPPYYYFIPFVSKYSPQHPIFKYLQFMLFP
jgi:hypothetical protein